MCESPRPSHLPADLGSRPPLGVRGIKAAPQLRSWCPRSASVKRGDLSRFSEGSSRRGRGLGLIGDPPQPFLFAYRKKVITWTRVAASSTTSKEISVPVSHLGTSYLKLKGGVVVPGGGGGEEPEGTGGHVALRGRLPSLSLLLLQPQARCRGLDLRNRL